MNVRTKIKSGQNMIAINATAIIKQSASATLIGNGVHVAEALNIGVAVQTNVAAAVATGGISIGVAVAVNA